MLNKAITFALTVMLAPAVLLGCDRDEKIYYGHYQRMPERIGVTEPYYAQSTPVVVTEPVYTPAPTVVYETTYVQPIEVIKVKPSRKCRKARPRPYRHTYVKPVRRYKRHHRPFRRSSGISANVLLGDGLNISFSSGSFGRKRHHHRPRRYHHVSRRGTRHRRHRR